MSEPRPIRELIAEWRDTSQCLQRTGWMCADELTAWVDAWDAHLRELESLVIHPLQVKVVTAVRQLILGLPDALAKDAARPAESPKTALDEQKVIVPGK